MGWITWLTAHWWVVVSVAYVVINILNAATRHWSEKKGLVKVLLFVAEALSIVSSAGRGPFIKPPLDVDKHAALLLLVLLGISGCCTTTRCYLARGLTAVEAADKLAQPALDAICTTKIKACGVVPKEGCPAYQQCTAAAVAYQTSMDAVGRGLAICNRTLAELGVK